MKKIVLALAFLSLLVFGSDAIYAQSRASDKFFESTYEMYREDDENWGDMPLLPTTHGSTYDFSAEVPVGSGLLLLGIMSVGYLAVRKKD